ncbi:hypothetical protein Rhopal_001716-T1 [Rhodotorula paludigena]|uniref:Uncharacterized protein n=1 Tax=Rhodotorula paludigena TaxID=86838 RepID=A0AAV5GJ82_9BASI|nr:hypothetical protein Rhopal_001716-T1 [Rhodotorula paludigena]
MVQMTKGKRNTLVQLRRDRHAALVATDQVKPDTGLPEIICPTAAAVAKAWFCLDKHKNNKTVEQLVGAELVDGVKAVMSRGSKYNACKLKIPEGKEGGH